MQETDAAFWRHLEQLITASEIIVDRPKGSAHPRYPEMIYPLDYGYLAGTGSLDGGGLDVWLGSAADRRLVALALTIDLPKRDAEIKLMVGCTEADIQTILNFFASQLMPALLIRRDDDP